jgi:hypothetical protein
VPGRLKKVNKVARPGGGVAAVGAFPPFSFVMIEDTVSITEEPEPLLYRATRIGGRYMGHDRADVYGKRNAVPGELVVRVRPVRIVGYERVAD